MDLDRLAEAAEQLEMWRTERDTLIRQARAAGYSLRQIAEAAGMTHPGVVKVLRKP